MRQISAALQAALDSEATSFCHCWKVIRRDGVARGFTDHDCDLAFSGFVYRANAGLATTDSESMLGFGVGGAEVSGALTSASLTEADLGNGLYDGARVETWLVDWRAPQNRLLLDSATLGEVRRSEFGFVAELRSLAHQLDQETGRRFQSACSADLGDAQCGMRLDTAAFTARSVVAGSMGGSDLIAAVGFFADGWFTGGRMVFLSGANAGASVSVKAHLRKPDGAHFSFWTPLAAPLLAGDAFEVTAGCDKSFKTCGVKFSNSVNFRGFPHIPGNDVLLSYPGSGDPVMDGGSLFR